MQSVRTVAALLVMLTIVLPAAVTAVDAPAPPADGELVRVVAITDGDTVRVERADGTLERVRYIGIDTPEIGHEPGEPSEPWGPEATEANRDLLEGAEVLLERDISDVDQYDRLLRYVWVQTDAGWLMVNGELVRLGLAEVRAYEPDTRHHAWFRQLEDQAREAGRGRFGDPPEDEGDLLNDILELIFGGGRS